VAAPVAAAGGGVARVVAFRPSVTELPAPIVDLAAERSRRRPVVVLLHPPLDDPA
jgi:hypothetical protein